MGKSTGVASGDIIHQVLTKDNYGRWKSVMQNYLQGQDLWYDIIEKNVDNDDKHSTTKDPDHQTPPKKMKDGKTFRIFQLSKASLNINFNNQNGLESKANPDIEQGLLGVVQSVSEVETEVSRKIKDAKALHIIQLSCGREIVDDIIHFDSAKKAWNHLSEQFDKDQSKSAGRYASQDLDDSFGQQHKELFRIVTRGGFIENIINLMKPDLCITSPTSGRTLLHVAVIAGNVENVKILMTEGRERLLLMQDKDGDTALSLVARYTGNTDMAKCLVETKNGSGEKLLNMQNKDKVIPILMAAANGHKDLTSYLYSQTTYTSKVFDGTDSQYRILLLSLCITAEIFDVALKLLKRYKDLPKESLSLYNFSIISKLLRESLSLPKLDSNQKPAVPDKFSALVALAKMPLAFPSGYQFSRWEQLIYDILSVEKEFKVKYEIPDIAIIVRRVTNITVDNDQRPLKTSSVVRIGFGRHVLNSLLLVMHYGHGIFYGIAYLFIQSFKFLNIFGVRRIYGMKCTHYEVIGILNYFCQSIGEFNDLQLQKDSDEGMLHAAQHGIIEFINAMRKANPESLEAVDRCNRGIFSYAVLHRKQNVFQLIHYLHGRKEIFRYHKDKFNNNLLHLAAQLGPSSDRDTRSGAALQMQREFQWFKAVEKVVHPKFKEAKNVDGKKPHEIFTENHDELVKLGEKWAKDTATSFTIVGTLITTIMFAAAFTVPGGNDQDTGLPIFLHDNIFTTFLIADAFSLFTSAASVLIFIGILTSRYAENDFLRSLPWKLLFGLWFLFLSVCSMIVAFCASITMILKGYRTYKWFIVGPTLSLGSIPIMVLVVSQLRLMYEILHSTRKNPISSIRN
ncbi:uncharacterized protein LOC123907653 isoform X2 [Trifolium pratense]|uniref:uncharacterized protein LOC123907653 isoform X2 n=1 Tax=Trifolium pratense TaxID=57577 RepID=UPI001E696407|nr:uncharacterized protein LOC123907653 isoform X2 [Trifolium pratense]